MNEEITPQRSTYMAALSLVEKLLSESTALPNDVEIEVHGWEPAVATVRVYFHGAPERVREFAEQWGMTVWSEPRGDDRVYTSARGGDWPTGITVAPWALVNAIAAQVAA